MNARITNMYEYLCTLQQYECKRMLLDTRTSTSQQYVHTTTQTVKNMKKHADGPVEIGESMYSSMMYPILSNENIARTGQGRPGGEIPDPISHATPYIYILRDDTRAPNFLSVFLCCTNKNTKYPPTFKFLSFHSSSSLFLACPSPQCLSSCSSSKHLTAGKRWWCTRVYGAVR